MCGLVGFLNRKEGLNYEGIESQISAMTSAVRHRGPDGRGIWVDVEVGLALGHTRLAILDLTENGHQPMVSRSGRYVIVFNGEIYNHLDLRAQLQDGDVQQASWRGHSDTETLLAAIDLWGLEQTLKKSIGMFALVLWDRQGQVLYLARDRLGEKPLYYGWQKGAFLFASELKAIKTHLSFEGQIDRNAIALQLRFGYIPAPYSIYKGIKKLPPGCFLKLRLGGNSQSEVPIPYWSLEGVVKAGLDTPFAGSDEEAIKVLDGLLRNSVHQQMVADVPLGAFLSGGVDSSTVVALMQSQSSRRVKTFSIGYSEVGYNEAEYAKAVARHLGTDHTELYVTSRQALDVIPRLPSLYDEPFSDASQIPTFLVADMTRQHVTVALSGDGGDELFGGYNRYLGTHRWLSKLQALPVGLRKLGSKGLLSIRPMSWDRIGNTIAKIPGLKKNGLDLCNKMTKLAGVLRVENSSMAYQHFVNHWRQSSEVVLNAGERMTLLTDLTPNLNSIVEQMMFLDTLTYLPDDVLVKVDRASMGVSLESRVPILDHRVVEFAWRLPLHMKIRNGQGKWILRQILNQYVPNALIDRPKMGFGVPIDSWLRGPLRDWGENLLGESRLQQEGLFNPEPIRRKWKEHLSGHRNWQQDLWDVLMFQAWLEQEQLH
jgi:asparagine synthase (glutamine-hydrolysing)